MRLPSPSTPALCLRRGAPTRAVVSQSRLEDDPRLKRLWAGYAFAVDFREERGHAYMLDDQTFSGRQQVVQQPGTCLHCHASVYVPYLKLGQGKLVAGFERNLAMDAAVALMDDIQAVMSVHLLHGFGQIMALGRMA